MRNYADMIEGGRLVNIVIAGHAIALVDDWLAYVGRAVVDEHWCVITKAQCILQWRDVARLGELALNGPTGETLLKPAGTVRIPLSALTCLIDTEAVKWNS